MKDCGASQAAHHWRQQIYFQNMDTELENRFFFLQKKLQNLREKMYFISYIC